MEHACHFGSCTRAVRCMAHASWPSKLSPRIRQHNENAMALADALKKHPAVKAVHYPGLKAIHSTISKRHMSGFGGMLGFEVRAVMKLPTDSSAGYSWHRAQQASAASRRLRYIRLQFSSLHDIKRGCEDRHCTRAAANLGWTRG